MIPENSFKKLSALILAALLVLVLTDLCPAATKVGGLLSLELSYAWNEDGFEGNRDGLRLNALTLSKTRLNLTYLSDDKKFKGFAEVQLESRTHS